MRTRRSEVPSRRLRAVKRTGGKSLVDGRNMMLWTASSWLWAGCQLGLKVLAQARDEVSTRSFSARARGAARGSSAERLLEGCGVGTVRVAWRPSRVVGRRPHLGGEAACDAPKRG